MGPFPREYGRSGQFALDLQLRGYAKKPDHWATLYVGLTGVAHLHHQAKKGTFKLDAHPSYKVGRFGWREEWETSQRPEQLAERWPLVEDYLERVIPSIGARHLKEGAVQSAISGFASQDVDAIDREAVVGFRNQEEKNAVTSRLTAPLLAAVERSNGQAWWKSAPTRLGNECDCLAVNSNGELLAIEIKPAKAAAAIRWSPLQARHYANLFTEWVETTESAHEILQGMVNQRVQLGLTHGEGRKVRNPIVVRPVVAIARGYSQAAIEGLIEVQGRLTAEHNDPPLEVVSVTLAGRMDPISL